MDNSTDFVIDGVKNIEEIPNPSLKKKRKTVKLASLSNNDINELNIEKLRKYLRLSISKNRILNSRMLRLNEYRKKCLTQAWKQTKKKNRQAQIRREQEEWKNCGENSQDKTLLELIMLGKVQGKSFHPKVREFAIQLITVSPKAYRFLRKAFNNLLPARSTINRWTCLNNASPGIITQSLIALSESARNFEIEQGTEAIFCLKFDEMSIHEALQFVPHLNEIVGLVNAGEIGDGDDVSKESDDYNEFLASKVLVFLLRGLNIDVCMPIGYLFIRNLNGQQKSELLTQIVRESWTKYNLKIKTVTCDGDSAHIAMMELLGGKILLKKLSESVNSTLQINVNGNVHEVHAMLCQSHGLKNQRNALGDKKIIQCERPLLEIFTEKQLRYFLGKYYDEEHLKNEENINIEWRYIVTLQALQELAELHLANKLNKKCTEYHKNKMKVVLAAVAVGDKTSDAIWFLDREKKLPEFAGSLQTVIFMKVCNLVFDILDSKNVYCDFKRFKNPICSGNVCEVFEFMDRIEIYFKNLTIDEIPLLQCLRRTGFLGALTGFHVARQLFKEYVLTDQIECIRMHTTNQDELENFFGRSRASLGNNTNPTSYQFACFMRNFLSFELVQFTTAGNCSLSDDYMKLAPLKLYDKFPNIPFKFSSQLRAPVKKIQKTMNTRNKGNKFDPESVESFENEAIMYISGFVQKRIVELIKCLNCSSMLQDPNESIKSAFIEFRDKGDDDKRLLTYPHQNVFDLCRKTEFFYKIESHLGVKNITENVLNKVMTNLDCEILQDLNNHRHDDENDPRSEVIRMIIDAYIKIRNRHLCKTINQNKNLFLRHDLSKQIIFKGK